MGRTMDERIEEDRILVSQIGKVALITFNRPKVLNAFSAGMGKQMASLLDSMNDDPNVRVVVFTGNGKGFCSGKDLKAANTLEKPAPRSPYRMLNFNEHNIASIRSFAKPTIAAVNGVAVGAGLGICLACDMRIASPGARFSAIFTKRGIPAQDAVGAFLPQIVGLPKALEMLYTGRIVEAEEALHMGLVSEILPHEALLDRALAIAEQIAAAPPLATAMIKQVVYRGLGRSIDDQLALQTLATYINSANAGDDIREANAAFKERRAPIF
ncbi:enoyl-CoA hydratase/isomerase family protein [Novosphingobium malaysiense]|nr:enoyl-CoA hydratase/isomerase family protein [Novosphingobium malaysiense]